MARLPDAIWKPVVKNRAARRKGRGICLHVAVSEAASLHGYFSGASSDSHFYVRKDGTIEQYVDTDLVAYANAAGNASLISVETQGGVTNADREPWTPQQVDALAHLCRWAADTDGFPLQAMPDSKPASRGVGYHRLGVKPWVVAGGEVWSSSAGKICPGAGKIAQIPQIIAAARGGNASQGDNDMDANQDRMLREVHAELTKRLPTRVAGSDYSDTLLGYAANADAAGHYLRTVDVPAILAQVAGLNAALNTLTTVVASGRDDLTADELRQVIRDEMASVVDVQVTVRGDAA